MKRKIIAGNWKMNKTVAETKQFVNNLLQAGEMPFCDIVLCVPFTSLATATELTDGTAIGIGAQNVHWADKGAFTGEVSVAMLKEIGVKYAVVGHSERRQFFGETDETVKLRTLAALNGGLTPIVCIGETLQQRIDGKTDDVLKEQVFKAFEDLTKEQFANVIVAYEPVWAIGTGKTASAEDADQTIAQIRKFVAQMFGAAAAENVAILYGGSMSESNAGQLLSMPNIDGGLIGGASLDVSKFLTIIGAAK